MAVTRRRELTFGIVFASIYMTLVIGWFLFMAGKHRNADVPTRPRMERQCSN